MRKNNGAGAWMGLGLLVMTGSGAAMAADDPAGARAQATDGVIEQAPVGQRGQSGLGITLPSDREGAATANYGSTTIERKAGDDAAVVAKLHHVNKMEIDAGALARDKGASRGVRDYGARLVADHKQADTQLLAYANKNGIDANAMPPAGTGDEAGDQAKMDRLRTLTGTAFDRAFVAMMADGHAKAIAFVESSRGTVHDSALRNMLGGLLPVLEKHQQIARSLMPNGRS